MPPCHHATLPPCHPATLPSLPASKGGGVVSFRESQKKGGVSTTLTPDRGLSEPGPPVLHRVFEFLSSKNDDYGGAPRSEFLFVDAFQGAVADELAHAPHLNTEGQGVQR